MTYSRGQIIEALASSLKASKEWTLGAVARTIDTLELTDRPGSGNVTRYSRGEALLIMKIVAASRVAIAERRFLSILPKTKPAVRGRK